MKKARLFLLCGALVSLFACQQDPIPAKDADLNGTSVDISGIPAGISKVFTLNEGSMGPTTRPWTSSASTTPAMSQAHSRK